MTLTTEEKLQIRAAVNGWIAQSFQPQHRRHLIHVAPRYCHDHQAWSVHLTTKRNGSPAPILGELLVSDDAMVLGAPDPNAIVAQLASLADVQQDEDATPEIVGDNYEFRLGDGIQGASDLPDRSIDLLLTDPPYGISVPYTCESQVSRRLRKDGSDFIMPRGSFGDWDGGIVPGEWTRLVLPKVRGWAVIFCAQAQIGEYSEVLRDHKFVAVGTLVWQKTNPVPFNHRYKPINAWEALVVGKRPGTKFNGHVVHNVFRCKSPSPQERIHPTQKPLPLIRKFVKMFSSPKDFVVDPFAGSGTTVVGAANLGRKVLAYEKDPSIYRLACDRILAAVEVLL